MPTICLVSKPHLQVCKQQQTASGNKLTFLPTLSTLVQTDRQTDTKIHTQDNYRNICAPKVSYHCTTKNCKLHESEGVQSKCIIQQHPFL